MSKSSRKKRKAQHCTVAHSSTTCESLNVKHYRQLSGERLAKGTKYSRYFLAGAVSLITFLAYLPSLQNKFVRWDDQGYVFENAHIRSINLAFLKWSFLSFTMGNWHPITWWSHAIDYAIWGLNPSGHHLTSIILHAVNTFLVVQLVFKLLSASSNRLNGLSSSFIAAGVTGLLFGLHPLHVESVAWVSERKDLLCGLFYLLSISQYMSYRTDKSYYPYFLSLFFFILALLSKPMAVTLPLVLLILDWYPFRRVHSIKTLGAAFVEKLPFFALAIVSSILTISAHMAGDAIRSLEALPISSRLLVAAKSLIVYIAKIILPLNLVPYYPYPKNISFFSFEYATPIILVMAITAICIILIRHQKLWISVWGYYVITLMPVLGIVQVGSQSMADRYMYLPSIGLFLTAGLVISWGWIKARTFKKKLFFQFSYILMIISVFLSLGYITLGQIKVWQNSLTFWTYVIAKEPLEVPLAYKNRGDALYRAGQMDKALDDYDTAIDLAPGYYLAYLNRGLVFAHKAYLDKAFADFSKAIELNPTPGGDRGMAYYNIACLFSRQTHIEEACRWLKESIENGYNNWAHMKVDADLDNIRNTSCYQEITAGKEAGQKTDD